MKTCQHKNTSQTPNANRQIKKRLRDTINGTDRLLNESEWQDIGNKKGIYLIQNKNGKFYIGSTSNSFVKRLRAHLWRLNSGRHPNPHLQASFIKNGIQAFSFIVVAIIEDKTKIKIIEQEYLTRHIGNQCYNISLSTECPMQGRKHTVDALAKIRQASIRNAKKIGALTRQRQLGTKHSASTIQKMKISARLRDDSKRLEYLRSDEHRRRTTIQFRKPKSQAHIAKLRAHIIAMNKRRRKDAIDTNNS